MGSGFGRRNFRSVSSVKARAKMRQRGMARMSMSRIGFPEKGVHRYCRRESALELWPLLPDADHLTRQGSASK